MMMKAIVEALLFQENKEEKVASTYMNDIFINEICQGAFVMLKTQQQGSRVSEGRDPDTGPGRRTISCNESERMWFSIFLTQVHEECVFSKWKTYCTFPQSVAGSE